MSLAITKIREGFKAFKKIAKPPKLVTPFRSSDVRNYVIDLIGIRGYC